jgi:hypothetical protein
MKQLILIISFTLVLSSASAQLTGGGKKSKQATTPSNSKIKNPKEGFKNTFYMYTGRTKGIGMIAQETNDYNDLLNGNAAGLTGSGLSFDLGGLIYLRGLNLPEQYKLAIDIGGSVSSINNAERTFDPFFLSLATKIGVVITTKTNVPKLLIDGCISIQPSRVAYLGSFETGQTDTFGYPLYADIEGADGLIRKALGINLRYRPFLVGLELSFGKANITGTDSDIGTYNFTLPTNRIDINFGFAF